MSIFRYVCVIPISLLLLSVAANSVWAEAQSDVLKNIIAEALENNPEIKASEARWDVFTSRVKQAGTFDDPMLMLKIQNGLIRDPLSFDQENMTSKVIGISQMVPFFGKRELRRESAQLDADASQQAIEERRVALRRMVAETWFRLYFADRSLEIVDKNIATLDVLNRFSETMYGVGKGLQQDVLRGQVERSKMEDMKLSIQQQRRSLEALMNILLYRPADSIVPPIPEATLDLVTLSQQELEDLALENRPQLRSLSLQIDKAAVGRKLAEKEFYPDFTFSLEYMQREATTMGSEGDDMYSLGVSFNLPFQRERRHAMLAEAEAENRMARQDLAMLKNQIRFDVADALARMERSRKMVELYREGLLPQAENSVESALAAYQVGKADFMNVLDSQMKLNNFERDYYEAIAEHQMQRAILEATVGTTLPAN